MALFIAYPLAALLVAAFFAGLWSWRRRVSALVAAATWFIYAGYEYLMLTRVLCTGECNIRVDLLLIYPALLILSIVAIVKTVSSTRGKDDGRRSDS